MKGVCKMPQEYTSDKLDCQLNVDRRKSLIQVYIENIEENAKAILDECAEYKAVFIL